MKNKVIAVQILSIFIYQFSPRWITPTECVINDFHPSGKCLTQFEIATLILFIISAITLSILITDKENEKQSKH